MTENTGHLPRAYDLQRFYVCGICGANIRVRTVNGELRALCDGPDAHDIEYTRDVITKATRERIVYQQESDADEVLSGLPPELRVAFERKGD